MAKKNYREGFTLIELSLSIIFVSILSLTIVLIISNTIRAYQRGLVLNQVNTVGMDVVDDMRSAVQNSSAESVEDDCKIYQSVDMQQRCRNGKAYNFVSVTRFGSVTLDKENIDDIPLFGAFCSGTYSYIWNSGYFWAEGATVQNVKSASLKYKDNAGVTQEITDFRLLKIRDDARGVCIAAVKNEDGSDNYEINRLPNGYIRDTFNITSFASVAEEPIDLILADGGNTDLALYDLNIPIPAESAANSNTFYTGTFILGTIRGGINIRASGKNCAAPSEFATENFNYCAINKFNFAAQASGE